MPTTESLNSNNRKDRNILLKCLGKKEARSFNTALLCRINISYNANSKGGKRPPPFILATWGSGGRRFESGRPDQLDGWWSRKRIVNGGANASSPLLVI